MAEVFIARRLDRKIESQLVLKRIRPDFANDSEYLKRFVLEAQVASRLKQENLVKFHEFGKIGDCHYIAMEHVQGHSLHRLLEPVIKHRQPAPLPVALHIAHGILAALSAMHGVRDEQGRTRPMLHRDVTPANVIVTRKGHPVLIDFGITKDVLGPSITLPGKVIGTARYMSPEHRKAEFIDTRADVFSASVILWELLTATHPWSPLETIKEILRTTFDPPEIPADARARVPADVEAVVQQGLLCDPSGRYLSANEMSAGLEACASFREIGDRGDELVRAWVETLDLDADHELDEPVVDHATPKGDGTDLVWSPIGKIATDEATAAPIPAHEVDAQVLTIPPLPPPRATAMEIDDHEELVRQAVGRPMWVTIAVIAGAILAALVGAVMLFRGAG